MPAAFKALHLDDVPVFPSPEAGGVHWRPVRHHLGIGAFGINAFSGDTGQLLSNAHDELAEDPAEGLEQEEVYVVVRGAARFTVGGESFDAPAGTIVFLPDPAVIREATATADATLLLAIGGSPTEAFRPSRWEEIAVVEHGAPRL